jgi:hypothetical protein
MSVIDLEHKFYSLKQVKSYSLLGIPTLKKLICVKTDKKCKMLLSLLMMMTTNTNKNICRFGIIGTFKEAYGHRLRHADNIFKLPRS